MERVTPEMWKQYISHVIKEEDKLYQIDFICEELMESESTASHVLTITGGTSDSEEEN